MGTTKGQEQLEELVEGTGEQEEDVIAGLVDSLDEQNGDLYDIVAKSEALENALEKLREAESGFTEAEEDGDKDTIAGEKEKCEEAAGELATQIDNARVLCHNMMIDLDALEVEALYGYRVSGVRE